MTYKTPLISIVVPTFNRGRNISITINSILNQSYKHFELIIVDDASTDDTESIVKNITDKRIKYIKLKENTKGTKPRNIGISLSKGEFITFLDSDDQWIPYKLEKQLNFILDSNLDSSKIMCFTGLLVKDGDSTQLRKNKSLSLKEDIMDYILVGKNTVQTSTYMISSSLAKATLFNSNLKKHQDWDFCLRLRNNNAQFLYYDECLTVWNVGDRDDRISNSYKNSHVSENWLRDNEEKLSEKAKWAFVVLIIVDNLIYKNKKIRAAYLSFNGFFKGSISFRILLKTLIKILLPMKLKVKFKSLLKMPRSIKG
ncbi:glycosyltransferase involved in cell wall biosynthesis [Pullulanibacillus pueri]|uniref:Glycosyltransferase 2-like domain-containing protein n=1 Tax=Pullulanibacillus pueri TaxID=1437324 RepID=A0A8J2ZWU1_9BACL|nr:glycosyltransferase family 2 protein [Pullulanibacillus pueri]MBM7681782.1 glycosyltransferase involved in cell wall biosynthesis [Pullulanibacillus pueri]GGH84227.1 hypothetical protein GCM10007096_26820 [Pullulanibacillus pueri]